MKLLKRPIIQVVNNHLVDYPTPINFNYWIFIVTIFFFFLFISSEVSWCEEILPALIEPSQKESINIVSNSDSPEIFDLTSFTFGFLAGTVFGVIYMTCIICGTK